MTQSTKRNTRPAPVATTSALGTFFKELLDTFETLTGISDEYGPRTVVDLLYLQHALYRNTSIEFLPRQSRILEVIEQLPSRHEWMKYIVCHDLEDQELQVVSDPAVPCSLRIVGWPSFTEFDVSQWLKTASVEQVLRLQTAGWSCDEAVSVARTFAKTNPYVGDILDSPKHFNCTIDPCSAMNWLREHRPNLWSRLV